MIEPMNRPVRHALRIEDIARHQHHVGTALGGKPRQTLHDLETRFGQQGRFVGFELPE